MPERTQESFTVAGKSTKIRLDLRKIVSAVQQIRRQLHAERASTATEFKVDPRSACPNQVKRGPTARLNSVPRRQGTWQSQPCFHAVNDKVPPAPRSAELLTASSIAFKYRLGRRLSEMKLEAELTNPGFAEPALHDLQRQPAFRHEEKSSCSLPGRSQ